MYKRSVLKTTSYAFVFSFLVLVFIYNANAEKMQSSSYVIQSDSVNFGGSDGSSSNYNLLDTAGELGSGNSNSSNYKINAGFLQMQETYIAVSSPVDLVLSNIGGLSGGSSEGTIDWNVMTDSIAGYEVTIRSSTSPALSGAVGSFADYTPMTSDPDYDFILDPASSVFAFSPEGIDTVTRFKDNGSICNNITAETQGKCWDGLSISPKLFAKKTSANHPSGSVATVRFKAAVGINKIQTAGTYSATITITATAL